MRIEFGIGKENIPRVCQAAEVLDIPSSIRVRKTCPHAPRTANTLRLGMDIDAQQRCGFLARHGLRRSPAE